MEKKTPLPPRKGRPSKMKGHRMPPRVQILRLARLASLLKRNSCPTSDNIIKEYREIELEEGKTIKSTYSRRTVCRDIALLREEYDCPIEFNKQAGRYFLTDPQWDFNCPANLSEPVMFALIIGGRIAEEIFPNPMRARIKHSVDELLKGNNPGFLKKTLIQSLKVFAEGGVPENPAVFSTVLDAWMNHRRIHIIYDNQKGSLSERDVDPHVLFFHLHEWRIKAFCHLKNDERYFVINRIKNAYPLNVFFEPDKKIIDSVSTDTLSNFKKLQGVKIRIESDILKYAKAVRMHSKQKIKKDGKFFLFTIPEIAPEVIVPWILSQQGQAVPIEPPELIDRVRSSIKALSDSLPK